MPVRFGSAKARSASSTTTATLMTSSLMRPILSCSEQLFNVGVPDTLGERTRARSPSVRAARCPPDERSDAPRLALPEQHGAQAIGPGEPQRTPFGAVAAPPVRRLDAPPGRPSEPAELRRLLATARAGNLGRALRRASDHLRRPYGVGGVDARRGRGVDLGGRERTHHAAPFPYGRRGLGLAKRALPQHEPCARRAAPARAWLPS